MNPSEDLTDAPGAPDESSDYTDAAPFDQREALARQLCRASGGNWDAKRHKRGHWLAKADALLAAERPADARTFNAAVALWLAACAALGAAAAVLAP